MSKYIKYNTDKYNLKNYLKFIDTIKLNRFDGIILPLFRSTETIKKYNFKIEYYTQINKMISLAESNGLKTAILIDVFNSYQIWQHGNFSAPITHLGLNYSPDSNYYPICPNNPLSIDRFDNIIKRLSTIKTNYIILDNFNFPFNWIKEKLDIQHKLPPYCYCPFCLTEFSTEIGRIISNHIDFYEVLPEWLEWRTNVIYKYFIELVESLSEDDKLIISTPPLHLIDIPFTIGQLPISFSEAETKISPKLFYNKKNKGSAWATNILNLYNLDLTKKHIVPALHIEKDNTKEILPFNSDDYEDILYY